MLLGRDWDLEQWVINTYLVDQGISAICVSSLWLKLKYSMYIISNGIIQIYISVFVFSLNLYLLEILST